MNQLIKKLWKMRGGVHPEFNKAASTQLPIKTVSVPPLLIVPLQQHIGEVPNLTLAVGDKVLKGQPLTSINISQKGAIVHAPSSGVISDIGAHPLPHVTGISGECVFIETDGLDQWVESVKIDCETNGQRNSASTLKSSENTGFEQFSKNEMLQKIESAGIVGLGGAAFPSAIKLALAEQQQINTLIINAAECEPYISCDDALMREHANEIIIGINVLMKLLQPKQCLIGIEDNKPEAIEALNRALLEVGDDNYPIALMVIATQYPSGDARQLTRILTGIEIPKNQHSLQSGVLCHNVATAHAVYQAVVLNRPLLSRIVTITGDGVVEARNIEALLGTPINYIIESLGGYTTKAERMIMGGPMMGFALPSDELPIIKASNCILVTSKEQLALATGSSAATKQVMPCIRCNQCADVCPVNLLPQQLYWHARAHDFDKVTEHNLTDCIECGACSYVCPSYIPLVDYFRFAKTEIKSQQQAIIKSSRSRERFEFNELRKQRIKTERDEKRKQHKEALLKKKAEEASKSTDSSSLTLVAEVIETEKVAKQDAIKAAMARAKAKKAAMATVKTASRNGNSSDAV